jgi:hypothetical protein
METREISPIALPPLANPGERGQFEEALRLFFTQHLSFAGADWVAGLAGIRAVGAHKPDERRAPSVAPGNEAPNERLRVENDYLRSLATQERRLAARESNRCDELTQRNEDLTRIIDRLTRENAALIAELVDTHGARESRGRPELTPTARDFYRLAATWKTEVRFLSNINQKCSHAAYAQIVEMGQEVLPFIFEELKREPDHWFAALRKLTGENPVPQAARGRLMDTTMAWLQWAEKHGYSDGGSTAIPASKPSHRSQDE